MAESAPRGGGDFLTGEERADHADSSGIDLLSMILIERISQRNVHGKAKNGTLPSPPIRLPERKHEGMWCLR